MNAYVRHFAEDDFVRDLSGDLTHLFHLTTVAGIDAAEMVAPVLNGSALVSLHTSRCGDRLQHRLTLTGLDPAGARDLAGRLSDLPGIRHVTVEHVIGRQELRGSAVPC